MLFAMAPILAFLILFFCVPAFAHESCSVEIPPKYLMNDETYEIMYYSSDPNEIIKNFHSYVIGLEQNVTECRAELKSLKHPSQEQSVKLS